MDEHTVLTIAGIGVVTIACQWFAWWVKLPAILFLLLAGIVAGPVTGWLRPDELFGDLLFPFVSLSVAVVLFEGSLTLRFADSNVSDTCVDPIDPSSSSMYSDVFPNRISSTVGNDSAAVKVVLATCLP